MEMQILYFIQSLRSPILDQIVLAITNILGSYGQIWVVIGAIMLLFKKTRKCGLCVIIAYFICFGLGEYGLKELVGRVRPCNVDTTVPLLVARKTTGSFPSTHAMFAFTAAAVIHTYFKKAGILAEIAAIIIGLSRLYLFMHYPTDVLAGLVLGTLVGWIVCGIADTVQKKFFRTTNA